jgi:cytochrome c biogenesis factor
MTRRILIIRNWTSFTVTTIAPALNGRLNRRRLEVGLPWVVGTAAWLVAMFVTMVVIERTKAERKAR